MDELPDEIMPKIAGYLPPLDTIHLNNTSKILHSKLSLTSSCPRQILTKFSRGDCDDDLHYGFQVPVPHQFSCHSVLLSLVWRDQGWGNRKGRIVIEAEEKSHVPRTSGRRCDNGRVVHTSGTAPHSAKRLGITFQPKESETYHLWYAVGGGGGHNVHLSNVRIQILVLGDPGRCFGKAYSILANTEALGVWDRKSRPAAYASGRRRQSRWARSPDPGSCRRSTASVMEEHLLPPLMTLANIGYLPEANFEPEFRAFIQSLWESWVEEYFVYAKDIAGAPSQQLLEQLLGVYDEQEHDEEIDYLSEDEMDFGEFVVPEE